MSGTNFKPEEKPVAPIIICAKAAKKQLEETKTLTATLENRKAEIGYLKLAAKLKQNELSEISKKGDLKTSTVLDISASSLYISQALSLLKMAFFDERSELLKAQANEYKKILANLEPLHVPQPKDERIEQLEQKITKVNHGWIMSLVRGAEMPVTRTSKAIIDNENQQKRNQQ
ncbi:AAEL009390-PA [Aedes aegypti]|uniref:AAEL009390-PA n=1 Tax=Aedes aegypti TaxID=7159 RepID=Q16VY4_AEDAE|nr:AAEL009390-PA [Aedes aegypti]